MGFRQAWTGHFFRGTITLMRESPTDSGEVKSLPASLPLVFVGVTCLVVGVLLGRQWFPLEIPRPFLVEREKIVEIPVDRVVEKRVEVPVERIIETRVEVPVERVVERRVEVPVERIVYRDQPVPTTTRQRGWSELREGMDEAQVRALIGNPLKILSSGYTAWEYADYGHVMFYDGRLIRWSAPSR